MPPQATPNNNQNSDPNPQPLQNQPPIQQPANRPPEELQNQPPAPEPATPPQSPVPPQEAPSAAAPQPAPEAPEGEKKYIVALLFSLLLGGLGVDRFYMGYTGLGILKLITIGGCGIWALIDQILILTGHLKDKKGNKLAGIEENKKLGWIIAGVIYFLGVVGNAVYWLAIEPKVEDSLSSLEQSLEESSEAQNKEASASTSQLAAAYEQVKVGMTKPEVESALGIAPESCSESDINDDVYETCLYGDLNDDVSISISYVNGTVESKTKTDF